MLKLAREILHSRKTGAEVQFNPERTPRRAITSVFSPNIKDDWADELVLSVYISTLELSLLLKKPLHSTKCTNGMGQYSIETESYYKHLLTSATRRKLDLD